MRTSPAGVALIKRFEGFEGDAYQDIAGVWTIGFGHTDDVEAGQVITEQAATSLLFADLTSREDAIKRLVTVPLNRNEFDALISFVYNIGDEGFAHSTTRRELNRGNRIVAGEALTMWNKATVDGVLREVLGLTRRREAERDLFLEPMNYQAVINPPETGEVIAPGKSAFLSEPSITPPEGRKRRFLDCGIFGKLKL